MLEPVLLSRLWDKDRKVLQPVQEEPRLDVQMVWKLEEGDQGSQMFKKGKEQRWGAHHMFGPSMPPCLILRASL